MIGLCEIQILVYRKLVFKSQVLDDSRSALNSIECILLKDKSTKEIFSDVKVRSRS